MKTQTPPLKRSPILVELSREHHHILVLAQGLSPKGNPKHRARLPATAKGRTDYIKAYFDDYLRPHFEIEEKAFENIGSGRGDLREAIEEMITQHIRITGQVDSLNPQGDDAQLDELSCELTAHVRFEERVLFSLVQSACTVEEMIQIGKILSPQRPAFPEACAI